MSQQRILNARDFASAQAFQRALFDGQTAFQLLLGEQREILETEVAGVMGRLPDEMDGQLGTQTLKKVPRLRIPRLIKDRMPFSTVARFYAPGEGSETSKADVLAAARSVLGMVTQILPPSSGEAKNHRYRYRDGFRFLIGETAYPPGAVSTAQDFTVLGVTNVSPQAATMENPTWPRPFTRAWSNIQSYAKTNNLDVQFRYIRGGSLPLKREAYWESRGYQLRDVTPYGVYLRSSDYGYQRLVRYSVPVIWIGPLNSMGGRTGRIKSRHRTHRRRTDGRKP